MIDKKYILDVGITNEKKENILEYVFKLLRDSRKWYIATPNPEILVYANKHEKYQKVLNGAEIALPDGIGVVIAAQILGKPLQERVTGVDFIENLCQASRENPISMGFLGGKPKIAEQAVKCLSQKYPWIDVAFVGSEWNEASLDAKVKSHQVIKSKSKSKVIKLLSHKAKLEDFRLEDMKTPKKTIDILFVAFGAPKQELWIAENLEKLPVKAAMGVGGAFDYLSGEVKRAPVWIRRLGFEWLFRLINQPWRWKRQLALIEFGWLVLREKLQSLKK